MKKFSLTTEYSETELLNLIEQCVQKTIQQELSKIISQLANSPPANNNYKLLTRKDLKVMLRLSYPTISRLTKEGILKAKIVGGSYRYLATDVSKYLLNR
jgi:hypothetical protein